MVVGGGKDGAGWTVLASGSREQHEARHGGSLAAPAVRCVRHRRRSPGWRHDRHHLRPARSRGRRRLAALPFDIGAAHGALSDATIGDVRGAMGQMPVPELSDRVLRTDHEVAGSGGVVVRVHRPVTSTGAAAVRVLDARRRFRARSRLGDDPRFDGWCPRYGCIGVSVQYRLAPETPYPGPLDDCYAGLAWVHRNADELGVDPGRIGIGGQSAGAGLAAGLALLARDRGEVPVAFQLLIYPMLDDRQITPSSRGGSDLATERQRVRLDGLPRRSQGRTMSSRTPPRRGRRISPGSRRR